MNLCAPRLSPRLLCLLRLLGPAVAGLLTVSAWAGATTSASVSMALSGCQATSVNGVPSGTPTSQVTIAQSSAGGCSMRASGFAYLGVVGASARTQLNGKFGSAGAIYAKASGAWSDQMQPDVPQAYRQIVLDLDRIELAYSIGATGSVSANRAPDYLSVDPGSIFNTVANGSADITYSVDVGGQRFSGSMARDGLFGTYMETGTWGTISGVLDLDILVDLAGQISFGAVVMSMAGEARSAVGNFGLADRERDAFGNADFGSTLIWNGITGAVGIDKNGRRVALPEDFRLNLIGAGGMNYWNPAQRAGGGTVSEPHSAWLVLAGLAGAATVRRVRRGSARAA